MLIISEDRHLLVGIEINLILSRQKLKIFTFLEANLTKSSHSGSPDLGTSEYS